MKPLQLTWAAHTWPRALLALMGIPLALGACRDNSTGPVVGENAALIQPTVSSVPLFWVVGEARAGQPFDVQINTFGPNSCWSKERTEVIQGVVVVITPYNRSNEVPPDGGCYQVVRHIQHVVTLSYPAPGEKHLVIRGRAYDTREPINYPVTVVVKP